METPSVRVLTALKHTCRQTYDEVYELKRGKNVTKQRALDFYFSHFVTSDYLDRHDDSLTRYIDSFTIEELYIHICGQILGTDPAGMNLTLVRAGKLAGLMPNLRYFKVAVTPQPERIYVPQKEPRQKNIDPKGSYLGDIIISAVSSIRSLAERMSISKRGEDQRKQEEEKVEMWVKFEAIGSLMASTGACCIELKPDEMTKATIFIMEK